MSLSKRVSCMMEGESDRGQGVSPTWTKESTLPMCFDDSVDTLNVKCSILLDIKLVLGAHKETQQKAQRWRGGGHLEN